MRAVLLEVPEAMLAERRRLGLDGRDEMWNKVLHVVPASGGLHQQVGGELFLVLGPLAKQRGLRPHYETGLFRAADDYRVPDQLYCRPEQQSKRGAEGAELLRTVGDRLLPVTADAHGEVRSDVLSAQFTTVEGRLRITWQDGVVDV